MDPGGRRYFTGEALKIYSPNLLPIPPPLLPVYEWDVTSQMLSTLLYPFPFLPYFFGAESLSQTEARLSTLLSPPSTIPGFRHTGLYPTLLFFYVRLEDLNSGLHDDRVS